MSAEVTRELTEEQLGVVDAPVEKNLFVLASAGSGKTRVLTERVAALINSEDMEAFEFCVLTFTIAAAASLQARLANLVGQDKVGEMCVGTFHSVAARIVYGPDVTQDPFANVDEVLVHFLRLLQSPDTQKGSFGYVFVDEVQDLNQVQASILEELGKTAKHVFLAGDEEQSIYGFRGARPRLSFELAKTLECDVKYLSVNHRASPELVALANSVSSRNVELRSSVDKPPAKASLLYKQEYFSPKKPWLVHCNAEYKELDFVCGVVLDGLKRKLVKPGDICIMSRRSKTLHAMHARFRRAQAYVPVTLTVSQPDTVGAENRERSAVTLSTIHGSKGLEYKWVFVLNVCSYFFPDARVVDLEEERRLFYVAVTRAVSRLWLLGNTDAYAVSLFAAELDPSTYYHVDGTTNRILPPITGHYQRSKDEYLARKKKAEEAGKTQFERGRHLVSMLDGAKFLSLKERYFVPGWRESVATESKDDLDQPVVITWPKWVDANFLRNDALKFWQLMLVKMTSPPEMKCGVPRELVKLLGADAGWKKLAHAPDDFFTASTRAAEAYADPNREWRSLVPEVWTLVTLSAIGQGRHILWSLKVNFRELSELTPHCEALEKRLVPRLKPLSNQQVTLREVYPTRVETVADMDFANSALVNFVPLSVYGQQDSLVAHLAFGHLQAAQCVRQALSYTKIVFLDVIACSTFELDFSAWAKSDASEFWNFCTSQD